MRRADEVAALVAEELAVAIPVTRWIGHRQAGLNVTPWPFMALPPEDRGRLSETAQALAGYLGRVVRRSAPFAWGKLALWAELLECSARTVWDAWEQLERVGLVERVHRLRDPGPTARRRLARGAGPRGRAFTENAYRPTDKLRRCVRSPQNRRERPNWTQEVAKAEAALQQELRSVTAGGPLYLKRQLEKITIDSASSVGAKEAGYAGHGVTYTQRRIIQRLAKTQTLAWQAGRLAVNEALGVFARLREQAVRGQVNAGSEEAGATKPVVGPHTPHGETRSDPGDTPQGEERLLWCRAILTMLGDE